MTGAVGLSIWSLRTTETFRRSAKLGLWLTAVSLFALGAGGVASAAGISTAGSCGGG